MQPTEGAGAPGEVIDLAEAGPVVACGDGAVVLTQVQPAGKPEDGEAAAPVTATCSKVAVPSVALWLVRARPTYTVADNAIVSLPTIVQPMPSDERNALTV